MKMPEYYEFTYRAHESSRAMKQVVPCTYSTIGYHIRQMIGDLRIAHLPMRKMGGKWEYRPRQDGRWLNYPRITVRRMTENLRSNRHSVRSCCVLTESTHRPCCSWKPSNAVPPRWAACWATMAAMSRWPNCGRRAVYRGMGVRPRIS